MQPLPSGSYSTARKLSLVEEKLVLQDGVKQPLTLLLWLASRLQAHTVVVISKRTLGKHLHIVELIHVVSGLIQP
jgi:hypothetical protein